MNENLLLEAALRYAAAGIPVFPLFEVTPEGGCACGSEKCGSPGKHPRIRSGFVAATTDPAVIRGWWAKWPLANIGVPTGAASMRCVLDVDPRNGGIESLAELIKSNGPLPPTLTVATGGDGTHYIFRFTPGQAERSRPGFRPGLDWKTEGGYVVVPPSVHVKGKRYAFLDGDESKPVAEAPAWLVEILTAPVAKSSPTSSSASSGERIPEGRRNDELTKIAGTLRRRGLSADEILPALVKVNANRCDPPLPDEEVAQIAASIGKRRQGGSSSPYFEDGSFRPTLLVEELLKLRPCFSSPFGENGAGTFLYAYEAGVYSRAEAWATKYAGKLLGRYATSARIDEAISLLRRLTARDDRELNPKAGELINLRNGMLDWKTSGLLLPDPAFLSTLRIPVKFDPAARSEIIDRVLNDWFPADAIGLAEELLGCLLIPSQKFQVAFMLIGEGENGKSTFLQLVRAFIGAENVSTEALHALEENRFRSSMLYGKLANICADIDSRAVRQTGLFKSITGGDAITAERKNQAAFSYTPFARLIYSANRPPPPANDTSGAYYRRWVVIPFNTRFSDGRRDRDLLAKITTEEALSALLNRALAGLRRLEARGYFERPSSVSAAGEGYRSESDPSFNFLNEECSFSPTAAPVSTQSLYGLFSQWCRANGFTRPPQKSAFERLVEAQPGVSRGRDRLNGAKNPTRTWRGLSCSYSGSGTLFDASAPEGDAAADPPTSPVDF